MFPRLGVFQSQFVGRRLRLTAALDCPNITQYEAFLISEREDAEAVSLAASQVIACMCGNPPTSSGPNIPGNIKINPCSLDPQVAAKSSAREIRERAQFAQVQSLRGLEELVRRLSVMPGQRSIVWVSPGFLAMDRNYETLSPIDHALRAGAEEAHDLAKRAEGRFRRLPSRIIRPPKIRETAQLRAGASSPGDRIPSTR